MGERAGRSAELRRALGLPQLVFYGVGLIVGAGIYSIVGVAAGEAGNGLWLAFLLAAAIALLTGLSYAELAAMYPKAGAEYTYAAEAYPRRPWVASAAGYVLLVAGIATTATIAAAFGGYVQVFLDVPGWAAALILMAAAGGIAVAGMRESAWVNVVMTLLAVGGLALLIYLGARHGEVRSAIGVAPPAGLAAAGALAFFSYLGFEDLANLTEEAKRPERQVPQAILISVFASALIYALVAVAALALLGSAELEGSESPLADAAGSVGKGYGTVLAAVALAATANSVLITIVALSRMLLALARDRHAPRAFGRILPGRRTPWVATLAITGGAMLFTPLGDVQSLGSIASFATLLAFALVNVVLIRLRYQSPDVERPFRVPGSVGRLPVLPVLGLAGALLFAAQLGWPAMAVGLALTAASFAGAYALERRLQRKEAPSG